MYLSEVGWPSEEWQIDFAGQELVLGSGEGVGFFWPPRFAASGDPSEYTGIMTGVDSSYSLDWSNAPVAPSGQSVIENGPLYNGVAKGPYYSPSGALLTAADRPFLGLKSLVQTTGPYAFSLLRGSPLGWAYAAKYSADYQEIRVDLPGTSPTAGGWLRVSGQPAQWPGDGEIHTSFFATGATRAARASGLVSVINSGSSLWSASQHGSSGQEVRIAIADWLRPAELTSFTSSPTGQLVPQSFAGTLVTAAPAHGFDFGSAAFGDGEFVRFTAAPT